MPRDSTTPRNDIISPDGAIPQSAGDHHPVPSATPGPRSTPAATVAPGNSGKPGTPGNPAADSIRTPEKLPFSREIAVRDLRFRFADGGASFSTAFR